MRSVFRRLRTLWKKEQPPVSPQPDTGSAATEPSRTQSQNPSESHPPPTEEQVYQVLRNCHDPEIPVNIVDLGLIYDVRVSNDRVDVKMTLTTQGCGMGGYIAADAEEQIRTLPGVREASVEVVWDPPWNPNMISPAGRKILGLPE